MAERAVTIDPEDGARLYIVYDAPELPESHHRIIVTEGVYAGNVNPDTGLDTYFMTGETVPDWAVKPQSRDRFGLPPLAE